MHGPNVKRLVAHKVGIARKILDVIPAGGVLADGTPFVNNVETMQTTSARATEWVEWALRSVRQARDPNPWKTADDEAIAGELLRHIEERKKKV